MEQYKSARAAAAGAIVSWMAVGMQFFLIIRNRNNPVPETIIQFFSYFTILTNILVACCFSSTACGRQQDNPGFFSRPGTRAATVVYIAVVSLIYNLVLRGLWAPQGLQRIVDELLHTFIPLFYIIYWFIAAPKAGIQWKHIFPWLLYPLVYLLLVLLRGAFSGFYPYPFISVNELGIKQVIINSGLITCAFILLSLMVIAASKALARKGLTS